MMLAAPAIPASASWLRQRTIPLASPGSLAEPHLADVTARATSATATPEQRIGALRSAFEIGEEHEQIATQPAAVELRDPCSAHPVECLDDGIGRRNRL
jgi:hypothetical protein